MNQQVPLSLLLYETLFVRNGLSPQEIHQYEQIKAGFYGEAKLSELIVSRNFRHIIPLFDIRLLSRAAELQIDCLLLTENDLFILEVKNYSGDYQMENNNLFSLPTKRQVQTPLTQVERTEFLFKRMLDDRKIHRNVQSYVVFINNNFMLYNASPELPMIFPAQIESFLKQINENAYRLTSQTKKLAHILTSQQIEHSSYERYPDYSFDRLKYGLFCEHCFSPLSKKGREALTCLPCRSTILSEDAILFAIAQFHLLFPKEKIRTETITRWCGNIVSKKAVRRTLQKHFLVHSGGKHTHYSYKHDKAHLLYLSQKYVKPAQK
ncbi:MAG TPA: nuclease-related domain-containing protein [Pseudogracilibacillus sp.]|nr:nuclease-related domain-containing protein [Pseudogracilibacillus sp.]